MRTCVQTRLFYGVYNGLVVLFFLPFLINMETPNCTTDETLQSCCPCYQGNTTCNSTCPNGYLQVWQSVECQGEDDEGPATSPGPSPDTTVTMEPPEDNNETSIGSTQEPPEHPQVLICLLRCPEHQVYAPVQQLCLECHPACHSCTGPEADACIVCRFNHSTECHASCPAGFQPGDDTLTDGSQQCVKTDEDGSSWPAMLGGSIGGVVTVAIVVVVIVIWIRRRRTQPFRRSEGNPQAKRNSEILKERNNKAPPKKTSLGPNSYENTSSIPAGVNLGREIQQGHCNVTRYTQDPTQGTPDPSNLKTNAPIAPEKEEIYGNQPAINVHRTSDTAAMAPTHIEELIQVQELQEIGTAPLPPTLQKSPKSKKGKKKKETSAKPVVDDGPTEDYLVMSGYIPPPGTDDLESYENLEFGSAPVTQNKKSKNRKDGNAAAKADHSEMETYEIVESKGGNLNMVTEQNCDPEEDYENTSQLKAENIYQNLRFDGK